MSQKQCEKLFYFFFNFVLLIKLLKHLIFTTKPISSIYQVLICHLKAYSEPFQTSKTRGLWIRLFSNCIFNQAQTERTPLNVWLFPWGNSSDEDCVVSGLKNFFACSWVYKFAIEWIPAIRNTAKIKLSPKYH